MSYFKKVHLLPLLLLIFAASCAPNDRVNLTGVMQSPFVIDDVDSAERATSDANNKPDGAAENSAAPSFSSEYTSEYEVTYEKSEELSKENLTETPESKIYQRQLNLIVGRMAKEYQVASDINTKSLEKYEDMTETEKQKFQENRALILTKIGAILHATRWSFGVSHLTDDSLTFMKEKVRRTKSKSVQSAAEELKTDATSIAQKTLAQRSHDSIVVLLKKIDQMLWSDARLVSQTNEVGLTGGIGLGLMSSVGKHHLGGIFELGFFIGFNTKTKSFVFQLFRNKEKFKTSLMPAMFFTGLIFKAGLTISNQRASYELNSRKGSSFYPPVVPGYTTHAENQMSAGFSSGLGFPPPPFDNALTYLNSHDNKPLLRFTVSGLNGTPSLKLRLASIFGFFSTGLCRTVFLK